MQGSISEAQEFATDRAQLTRQLKINLQDAQHRMKYYADKRRTEREFEVGDRVYLKLQPYSQSLVASQKNLKLSPRYYGLFVILERIGKVAYKLDLPKEARIHPVFHVSLLKKVIGAPAKIVSALPLLGQDGTFCVKPVGYLDRRVIQRGRQQVSQILVLWLESNFESRSWEDEKFVVKKFGKIDPWGQGSSVPGSIVMIIEGTAMGGATRAPLEEAKDGNFAESAFGGGENEILAFEYSRLRTSRSSTHVSL